MATSRKTQMWNLRNEWLAALCEGNCLKIDKFLVGNCGKDLLCLWPDEAEAQTVGRDWKGCNAMHVAVKHGWRDLVIKIIRLLDVDEEQAAVDSMLSPSGVKKGPRDKLRDMILSFDGNCKLDAIAIAIVNGDRRITQDLARALLRCRSNPYGMKEKTFKREKEDLELLAALDDELVQMVTQYVENRILTEGGDIVPETRELSRDSLMGRRIIGRADRYCELQALEKFPLLRQSGVVSSRTCRFKSRYEEAHLLEELIKIIQRMMDKYDEELLVTMKNLASRTLQRIGGEALQGYFQKLKHITDVVRDQTGGEGHTVHVLQLVQITQSIRESIRSSQALQVQFRPLQQIADAVQKWMGAEAREVRLIGIREITLAVVECIGDEALRVHFQNLQQITDAVWERMSGKGCDFLQLLLTTQFVLEDMRDEDEIDVQLHLEETTQGLLKELGDEDRREVELYFEHHCEFNFLDMNKYLFHALASYRNSEPTDGPPPDRPREMEETPLSRCAHECWKKILADRKLKMYVFQLKDGRGRTPFHVAADHDAIREFCHYAPPELLERGALSEIFEAKDAAGRQVLHRVSAAVNFPKSSPIYLPSIQDEPAYPTFDFKEAGAGWCVDVGKVSIRNGFGGWLPCIAPTEGTGLDTKFAVSGLHMAIFNPRASEMPEVLTLLYRKAMLDQDLIPYNDRIISLRSLEAYRACWKIDDEFGPIGTMELAVLVGNNSLLQVLMRFLSRESLHDQEGSRSDLERSLLIATAIGNSVAMKIILDSFGSSLDVNFKKKFTTMHAIIPTRVIDAAVIGWESLTEIKKHLFHVVHSRDGAFKMASDTFDGKIAHADQHNRRACVNLALQAGATLWSGDGEAPAPAEFMCPEFHAWWSEKMEREFQETKTRLNTAAYAISVTAALVATASYVGLLQPPKGYAEKYIQVEELSIKLFIVFDTLAFCVALAAIVLAMIPSLPLPKESVKLETRRARDSVIIAATLLIVSMVCILVAFASASMSIGVISSDKSWNHGRLTMGTISAGGLICLWAIVAFLRRLSLIKLRPGRYNTMVGFFAFYLVVFISRVLAITWRVFMFLWKVLFFIPNEIKKCFIKWALHHIVRSPETPVSSLLMRLMTLNDPKLKEFYSNDWTVVMSGALETYIRLYIENNLEWPYFRHRMKVWLRRLVDGSGRMNWSGVKDRMLRWISDHL